MTRPSSARFRRLGIDVWVRRGRSTAPNAHREETEAATTVAPLAVDAEARARHAQPPGAPAEKARGEAHRPATAPKSARSAARPASKPPAQTKRGDAPAPATPLHIRCFRFGDVFAAIGEDAWPQRRLLLDVALALNGFRPAERQDVVFSWPQPGAPPDGGERAFRAFFGHRTQDCGFALLSGKNIPPLLGRAVPEQDVVLDDAEPRLRCRSLYIAPRALDADAKRKLWRLIRTLA